MNKDQINNGEVRVFPFYKGKYMGELPFGYSNEKSAKKFMKTIPSEFVYEKFGGKEEYVRTHECLLNLNKTRLAHFNPAKGASIYSQRDFKDIYDHGKEKIYLKDLEPDIVKQIREDISNIGFWCEFEKHDLVRKFQEKYDMFPYLNVDCDDYDKAVRQILKDEVVYRKGILHVNVEYIDETEKTENK